MKSSSAIQLPITAAEYLEGELRSEIRHEFVDGRVYAMSGASLRHNSICGETYDLDSIIRFDSINFAAPLAAFYQSAPFPPDVPRPWYLINREDG